jgi:hypothetical protein
LSANCCWDLAIWFKPNRNPSLGTLHMKQKMRDQ